MSSQHGTISILRRRLVFFKDESKLGSRRLALVPDGESLVLDFIVVQESTPQDGGVRS